MKILHIEAGRHLYGGAKQVEYLLTALAGLNVENILVCPKNSAISNFSAPSLTVEPIAMAGELDVFMMPRLLRLFKRYNPDIIHIHSRRGADIWGALAAKWAGIPCICSRRVDNPEASLAVRLKYPLFAAVICISDGIRRVVCQSGVEPKKVVTVHSSVKGSLFEELRDRDWFAQEFCIPQDSLVVANFAQMIDRKGQMLILEAVSRLAPEFPTLRLLLFGQGPRQSHYQGVVKANGMEAIVTFPGFRQDVPKILPNIDVVIHPAYTEGLGVALLQSAASGVPIVATTAGGIPEVVRHNVNGKLVPVGDIDALTYSLRLLLLDQNLRQDLGRAGRKLVEEEFSVEAMAKGNLAVYEHVYSTSCVGSVAH